MQAFKLTQRLAWTALALLIAAQIVAVTAASRRLSPAMDEPIHVQAGMAMLTHGRFIDPQRSWWTAPDRLTPPVDLLYALAARAAGLAPDFRDNRFVAFGPIRAARWVSHLAGAAMLALVFVWGRRLWGEAGGLLAASLLALNPLFLAHATIVSTDLTGALGALLAAWTLWRVWLEGRAAAEWGWRMALGVLLTGAALGLATACKISNLLFVAAAPVAILWGSWLARRRGAGAAWLARAGVAGATAVAVALLAASAAYGWMDLHDREPLRLWGRERTLPFGQELAACALWASHLGDTRPEAVFYKGWYQTPSIKHAVAAFLYKTPLPLLVLLGLGGVAALWRGGRRRDTGVLFLLLMIAALKMVFLTRGFYLGLRHLLPVIVMATLLTGALEIHSALRPWFWRAGWGVLLLWNLAVVVTCRPWYGSYFNPLAGDRLVLVDSDLDWGQGLIALADWENQHSPDAPIWLGYFGNNRPEAYGVRYRGLLSPFSGVSQDPEWARGREPEQLTGWVAISATHLAGRYLWDAGQDNTYYAKWLAIAPAAKIAGGSIWIYDRRKP